MRRRTPGWWQWLLQIGLPIASIAVARPALARGSNEASAGVTIAIYMPNYGLFNDTALAQSEPGFPSKVVAHGGHVTFARRGFLIGGRAWSANTQSEGATSGSHFSTSSVGAFTGGGYELGILSLEVTGLLGYGTTTFSSSTATSGRVVEVEFLSLEPTVQLGLTISSAFKVTFGFLYQYGIARRLTQYGTDLIPTADESPLGGSAGLIMISFGNFN